MNPILWAQAAAALSINPVVWTAASALTGVGLELAYRRGLAFWPNVWWIAPLSLLLTYGIYQTVRSDLGWLGGIVIFGAMTAALRLSLAFTLGHETPSVGSFVSGVVLGLGVLVRLIWR